ncbi:unnamed protein product, partial [Rotaria sordida]
MNLTFSIEHALDEYLISLFGDNTHISCKSKGFKP